MPKRTIKDCLTLFCANVSRDFKANPLLLYHYYNTRAFKEGVEEPVFFTTSNTSSLLIVRSNIAFNFDIFVFPS